MIEVKTKAPEFCLPNQDEVEICLRDLKGKWVVLYFYPKDNTPGCTTQACDFTAQYEYFENLNAIILGISPDNTKKHRSFIEKKKLEITLLSDEDKNISEVYNVWQLKKFMGREYMGIVRSTFLINPDGNIEKIWEKVKVKGHVQEVRDTLEELQNG